MPVQYVGKGVDRAVALAGEQPLPSMLANRRAQLAGAIGVTVGRGAVLNEMKRLVRLQIFRLKRRPDICRSEFLECCLGCENKNYFYKKL